VTARELHYKHLLLKLSGQLLGGEQGIGFDPAFLDILVGEIKGLVDAGIALGVVLGAGNILRGRQMTALGMDRISADQAGMVATVINGIVLADALKRQGIGTALYSAIPVGSVAEVYHSHKAKSDYDDGRVVLLSGGTGNPFFTTDTAAVLRGKELGADVVIKGTRVEGLFSGDPEKDPQAEFISRISYEQVITRKLAVMDLTAVSLAWEVGLPIIVFKLEEKEAMLRIALGEQIGTKIGEE